MFSCSGVASYWLLRIVCNKRTYSGDPIRNGVGAIVRSCGETWGRLVNSIQNNKYFHLFHPLIPAGVSHFFGLKRFRPDVRGSCVVHLRFKMLSPLFMCMCVCALCALTSDPTHEAAQRHIRCKITALKIGCVNTFGCWRGSLKRSSADWVYCFAPKMVNFESIP